MQFDNTFIPFTKVLIKTEVIHHHHTPQKSQEIDPQNEKLFQ